MNSEQDETTTVRPDGTSDGDYRDYAKVDQEAADGLLRHFGVPDSSGLRQRVQEDREARAKAKEEAGFTPIPQEVFWMVNVEGESFVRLEQDLLAGDYTLEDAGQFAARFEDAATMAKRMSALMKWLQENGVEQELIGKLIAAAAKDIRENAAKEALLAIGGIFGRGGW